MACLLEGHVLEGTIRDRHQAPQGPNRIRRTDSIARGPDCGRLPKEPDNRRSSWLTPDHDFEAELERPIRLQVVAGPRIDICLHIPGYRGVSLWVSRIWPGIWSDYPYSRDSAAARALL